MTKQILKQIERLGYLVKVIHVNGAVEIHALSIQHNALQIARCRDGDGPDEECHAAFVLAEALGIKF